MLFALLLYFMISAQCRHAAMLLRGDARVSYARLIMPFFRHFSFVAAATLCRSMTMPLYAERHTRMARE